jgi:hypothetical protein
MELYAGLRVPFGGCVQPLLWGTGVRQRIGNGGTNGMLLLAYFLIFNFDTRRDCIRPRCAQKKNPSMIEFSVVPPRIFE